MHQNTHFLPKQISFNMKKNIPAIIIVVILAVLTFFGGKDFTKIFDNETNKPTVKDKPTKPKNNTDKPKPSKGKATRDENLALGNPSKAKADAKFMNNYLIACPQYALAFDNNTGNPKWVAWHLSKAWKGDAKRQDFRPDNRLPKDFKVVTKNDYTASGFDRGHLCPSDDRDGSISDNEATFFMSNIIPQAPKCNQRVWKGLEDYCRDLAFEGNELYIVAGAYGVGGTGSNGGLTKTIAKGKVTVPAKVWKVVVVLPIGENDLTRIDANTRVIAVDMPNNQSVADNDKEWWDYLTTVDEIEKNTGLDLLSNLQISLQKKLETRLDKGENNAHKISLEKQYGSYPVKNSVSE